MTPNMIIDIHHNNHAGSADNEDSMDKVDSDDTDNVRSLGITRIELVVFPFFIPPLISNVF
jgi:hypothetical protein